MNGRRQQTPPDESDQLACASCGATDQLLIEDPDAAVFFCLSCTDPISTLPFPEYYCDLGCGD